MNDIMIDIETLGKRPGCVILSIAAVAFDRESFDMKNIYYGKIDTASSLARGYTVDLETAKWWFSQEDRSILCDGKRNIRDTLVELSSSIFDECPDPFVWANGADFDISILYYAFDQEEIQIPWRFNAVRDLRTAKDVLKYSGANVPPNQNKHDALADCRHQILQLRECLG